MRSIIYFSVLLFVFVSHANEGIYESRSDLSSDDLYFVSSQKENWVECYKNDLYSIVKRADGIMSFKLIIDEFSINDEPDLYLITTPFDKTSYVEKLKKDYDELFGLTDAIKREKFLVLSDQTLQDRLDQYNENIDYYKRTLLLKYQATNTDDLVTYSAHLYRLRRRKETRPNPFIAKEYEQELRRRKLLAPSREPFNFKLKQDE